MIRWRSRKRGSGAGLTLMLGGSRVVQRTSPIWRGMYGCGAWYLICGVRVCLPFPTIIRRRFLQVFRLPMQRFIMGGMQAKSTAPLPMRGFSSSVGLSLCTCIPTARAPFAVRRSIGVDPSSLGVRRPLWGMCMSRICHSPRISASSKIV